MSITQTYFLAHTARGKLSSEAARPDHNLRLLVGHANLLDSLMLELADAEAEQESWFNQSVKTASAPAEKRSHIQWADAIVEEPEEDWQAEDADLSDSDSDDSDFEEDEDVQMQSAGMTALRRVKSHETRVYTETEQMSDEEDEEEYEDDGEEDYAMLTLTRTQSHHSATSPPELSHDDSESDEDDSMPPSPPSDVLPAFSEKQREQIVTTSFYSQPRVDKLAKDEGASFFDQSIYLPQQQRASLVSAVSVY